MRILLIEDDRTAAAFLADGLLASNHEVTVEADGPPGMGRAAGEAWDLLIVDRMLPGLDGVGLVRTLRGGGITVPVLFLTALGGIDDRVGGLNAGGDDYLVKPYALAELAARVAALGRRPHRPAPETILRAADVEIELLTRTVRRAGRKLDLQPREFALLEYLMRNAGHVVTRTMLLENVWHFHFDPKTNLVESHVSRLRAKLDDSGAALIQTVRGAGYRLAAG